jgi:hypothetical protein
MTRDGGMTRRRRRNGNGNGHGYAAGNVFSTVNTQLERDIALLQAAQDQQDDEVRDLRAFAATNFSTITAKIEALGSQLTASGKTNWPVIIGLCFGGFSVAVTLTSGAYFLTSQQMQVLAQPLQIKAETLDAAVEGFGQRMGGMVERIGSLEGLTRTSADKDARSEADRGDLHLAVERNRSLLETLRDRLTVVQEKTAEIETQFDAAAQIENARWEAAQRTLAMIWEKVWPGSRYPDRPAFFPNISGRRGSPMQRP